MLKRKKKIENSAVILKHQGEAAVVAVTGELIEHSGEATYRVEDQSRFWLPEPVPAGWLTVFVEADPEPVTHREPAGYDAKALSYLTGGWLPHVVGAGYKGRTEMKPWMLMLVVGAIALSLLIAGAMWYQRRFGGA